jgi:uncharacterized protein (DUF697 family)
VATKLHPAAVVGVLRELREVASDIGPLQVSGVLAEPLARQLRAGGQASAVRVGGEPGSAGVLVLVLGGGPRPEDEELLRAAGRARTPVIAVQTAHEASLDVPYVLATDIVPCPPGAGFPVAEIAGAIAHRLGERGTALAARLPVLREAVCRSLISSFSLKNGVIGAAVFVPGTDLPVLTLNQLRLVLRIAAAHGEEVDGERVPEVLATLGSGFVFRAVARQALGLMPVAGWAVKGAVAYGGTRALGETAVRWFGERAAATTSAHEPSGPAGRA